MNYTVKKNIYVADEGYIFQNKIKNILAKKIYLGKNDIIDNWIIIKEPLRPTLWNNDTEYKIDDKVFFNDILYICLYNHISSSNNAPNVSLNYWKEVKEEA